MTCGTGSQSIFLAKRGFKVTANDLSKGMLRVAKKKSKGLGIGFNWGDIRKVKLGKFDAVISMFNSIGHLTKNNFEKAIRNVSNNLKDKGIYIFDIFNLDYMSKYGSFGFEFIDVAQERDGFIYTRFNKNNLDKKKGIMTMNQKTYTQKGYNKPDIKKESWDMQIYNFDELKSMLSKNGFKILETYDVDGKKFKKDKSMFIHLITQKIM